MTTRTPGKLNVGSIGGKLNNLLLAGPPGKSPNATLPRVPGKLNSSPIGDKLNGLLLAGPSTPVPKEKPIEKKPENSNKTLINVLKSRPRPPTNRRPPSRSMPVIPKPSDEEDEKVKELIESLRL